MIDIEEIKRNLGRKFQLKRQEIGYSQAELTEHLDMESQHFISNFENGKKDISFRTFFKACKIMNTHPLEFFLTPSIQNSEADKIKSEIKKIVDNLSHEEAICVHNVLKSICILTHKS